MWLEGHLVGVSDTGDRKLKKNNTKNIKIGKGRVTLTARLQKQ